jgi:hypothetical protein|tara:strand:- start:425 stop:670 length:246 start_codon:yes stop_codon:yes gene_type:complete
MIERVMSLPIFMFTRVALSALISAIAGIMMISFLWMLWSFIDDVYNHLLFPEEEVVIEETSIDEFPHIQPITVTAQKRPIK